MSELQQWFAAQPFSTKWLTVLSLLLPLLMKFAIVSPHWLVWDWYSMTRKFQVWRILTPLFLAPVNFNLLISLYFRSQYSFYLETGVFAGRAASYLYFLLLSTLLMNAINCFIGMAVLWESLSMAIVYVWAQYNRAVIVNFMFGFKFPAVYLPAVLALFEFLLAGDFYGPLVGILVGHAYYFLSEVHVQRDPRWRARLNAPIWLRKLVPEYQPIAAGSFQGFSVQKPDQAFGGRGASSSVSGSASGSASSFTPFAGRGHKLGS